MKRLAGIAFAVFLVLTALYGQQSEDNANNKLLFSGQLSMWAHYNFDNKQLPAQLGARYIPQLTYGIQLPNNHLLDFEASANAYGDVGFHPFDTAQVDGKVKPYRAWARYSSEQYELRLGLQKISFGSASMFRPLMWFDQLDPRDPLQMTDGVWGGLFRYYFLNNANIWLWALYGSDKPKGWEIVPNNTCFPEVGGRIQYPTPRSEIALSYNFRMADTEGFENIMPAYDRVPEHRLGLDGKWDIGIGLWFEGAYVHKNRDLDIFTNQEMLTLGCDYTFGWGNGLNATFEQLVFSYDRHAFAFSDAQTFSGLSLSYPLGMLDNLSTMVYYDWVQKNTYSFFTWQRTYDKWAFYVMAYWNPDNYAMPMQGGSTLYAGKGIQLMAVFNH